MFMKPKSRLMEERPVVFYCDFHSHSRKHNVFIYGCEDKEMCDLPLIEQVFPLMMHRSSGGKVIFQVALKLKDTLFT